MDAYQGVVHTGVNGAVVMHERIGNSGQTQLRFRIVGDNRFLAPVAAGCDQNRLRRSSLPEHLKQQIMHRRVWKHDTEPLASRRDTLKRLRRLAPVRVCHVLRVLAAMQQDNGPFPAEQHGTLGVRDHAEFFRDSQIGHHYGEGFLTAPLATAQLRDRCRLSRVAEQLVAAQALPGDDSPGLELFRHSLDHLASALTGPWCISWNEQLQSGTAHGACIGLRVKAPVGGVVVLAPAVGAKSEGGHRRLSAIVRDIEDDAVARTAVGAVGKGIFEAPVGGIADVVAALITDADIRRHQGEDIRFARAGANHESGVSLHRDRRTLHAGDSHQRRPLHGKSGDEIFDGGASAFQLDNGAFRRVHDEPGQAVLLSETVHVGSEADALHDAPNKQARTFR